MLNLLCKMLDGFGKGVPIHSFHHRLRCLTEFALLLSALVFPPLSNIINRRASPPSPRGVAPAELLVIIILLLLISFPVM
jgi:hypothetical protein